MPRWVGALALMLPMPLATTAWCESPPADDLTTTIKSLLMDLDADSLAKRDAAERAIVELGPRALEALPTENDSLDAEIKQRLKRIRQTLETRQVAESSRPALVTLSGSLPLTEVLEKMSAQSGNRIVDYREQFGGEPTNPTVNVDFHETPFWEALDQVLDECELTTYGYAGDQGRCICLVGRSSKQRPRRGAACYSGPFRIQPLRFESVRDLQSNENSQLRLIVEITWEPRLQPVALSLPIAELQAVGDGDEPVSIDASQGEPEAEVMEGVSAVEIGVPFSLPSRSVVSIATLNGKIQALTAGQIETFRFDNLAPSKDKKASKDGKDSLRNLRRAGVVVGIERLRKNSDLWDLQLRVKFEDAGRGLESHRGWVYQNEAFIVGADQKPMVPGAYEMTSQSEDSFGMKYLFDLPNGPDGLTFVYKTPTSILELGAEFKLIDLALP